MKSGLNVNSFENGKFVTKDLSDIEHDERIVFLRTQSTTSLIGIIVLLLQKLDEVAK